MSKSKQGTFITTSADNGSVTTCSVTCVSMNNLPRRYRVFVVMVTIVIIIRIISWQFAISINVKLTAGVLVMP